MTPLDPAVIALEHAVAYWAVKAESLRRYAREHPECFVEREMATLVEAETLEGCHRRLTPILEAVKEQLRALSRAHQELQAEHNEIVSMKREVLAALCGDDADKQALLRAWDNENELRLRAEAQVAALTTQLQAYTEP